MTGAERRFGIGHLVHLKALVTTAVAVVLCGAAAFAQESQSSQSQSSTPQSFAPEAVKAGAELYATNCSPCHGVRLNGAEMAFDLRKFPVAHSGTPFAACNGQAPSPPAGFQFYRPRAQGTFQPEFADAFLEFAVGSIFN